MSTFRRGAFLLAAVALCLVASACKPSPISRRPAARTGHSEPCRGPPRVRARLRNSNVQCGTSRQTRASGSRAPLLSPLRPGAWNPSAHQHSSFEGLAA